jgi:acyl-CoA hydrolase
LEERFIEPFETKTLRLVKSEDLNHHGTLFAGRTAEWFVESGFIAAASVVDPKNVVCLKIHGMYFSYPVKPGQVIAFTSKIVYTGKTSLIAYIKVNLKDIGNSIVDGFVTFVNVDENTKPHAHGIEIVPKTDEDKLLFETAKNMKRKP